MIRMQIRVVKNRQNKCIWFEDEAECCEDMLLKVCIASCFGDIGARCMVPRFNAAVSIEPL